MVSSPPRRGVAKAGEVATIWRVTLASGVRWWVTISMSMSAEP
jgi:hypothetical protein